jgi:hypothetical protein
MFTLSVVGLCPCIQHNEDACKFLTDMIIFIVAVESKLRSLNLLCCIVIFGSVWSRITQISNFYCHVGYTISNHLIAGGYDICQQ